MSEELRSAEIRGKLVDALRLDLVGPSETLGDAKEALPQSPSRWYLTGFLGPARCSTRRQERRNRQR